MIRYYCDLCLKKLARHERHRLELCSTVGKLDGEQAQWDLLVSHVCADCAGIVRAELDEMLSRLRNEEHEAAPCNVVHNGGCKCLCHREIERWS